MDVVFIFRITAELIVAIVVERGIAQEREVTVPLAVVCIDIKEVGVDIAEVVSTTVALLVFILILVTELQISFGQDRFAVEGLDAVVPVGSGSHGVSVGLIG